MKFKEIRGKKGEELEALEAKLRGELCDLKLKLGAAQLRETARIGSLRRDIARILTARRIGLQEGAKKSEARS